MMHMPIEIVSLSKKSNVCMFLLFLLIKPTVDSFFKIIFQVFKEVWPMYTILLINP